MSTSVIRPNADAAELEKFSSLASRWWDPEGEFAPLHAINPLRLGWISDFCGGLQGKRIVDVGCGGGILAEAMAKAGAAEVTGIDLSVKSLSVARLHALESKTTNLDYRAVSAEAFAAENAGRFDLVTCMEMLEHVPDPAAVVSACAAMVRPGGSLVFSTLNRNAKSWLFAILGAEYLLRILPRGTHDHARFIKPAELALWLRNAGLDLHSSKGLEHNPLTGRYWLSDNTDVNYMLAARKP